MRIIDYLISKPDDMSFIDLGKLPSEEKEIIKNTIKES